MFKRDMVADTAAGKARQARLKSSGERWLAPLPMFHAYVSSILPLKDTIQGPSLLCYYRSPKWSEGVHHAEI
jgi:hypothetical protein